MTKTIILKMLLINALLVPFKIINLICSNLEINIQKMLIANVLYSAYKRSSQTIKFWEQTIEYKKNFNNQFITILNRMRNPSKFLNNKYEKINIDIQYLFDETSTIYDEYATALNFSYEKDILNKDLIDYLENIRQEIRKKSLSCFKQIIFIFKEIYLNHKSKKNKHLGNFLQNAFLKIFKFIKNTNLLYNYYIESDRMLCKIYEKYINTGMEFDKKYQIFWNCIEKIRMEEFKKAYNDFIRNNSFINNKILKINIIDGNLKINEEIELPKSIS